MMQPINTTTENAVTLDGIMPVAIELHDNGADYKRLRSWLIGRTTYQERNRILNTIFESSEAIAA